MSRVATATGVSAIVRACGAALWLCSGLSVAAVSRLPATPGALPAVKIRDLYYGDVLFYFYQDDYFTALTRLTAAQAKGRLPHHSEDAELLLGGLYLSVGQHREAGEIFSAVLERKGVPAAVRDRARFFLGKVWYQRGYLDKAVATLAATGPAGLTPDMDAERRMLLAQALLYQAKYGEAARVLENWQGPAVWQAYAQFNLAVALIRDGKLDPGARLLNGLGRLERTNAELDALRDKANLALGYAMLQANRPVEARTALERVRLEGPLSTKALLGVGWAASASEQYREALVPWLELHGRNLLDSAVQESYLAVPYAFGKLGANREASDYYEIAIREFGAETARLDESIAAIRSGGLLEAILKHEASGQIGSFWQLASVPDAPSSRYLYHLLAQNDFQEGLKNFRMMRHMESSLDTWTTSVDAFDDMLSARRERYASHLPQAIARLGAADPQEMQRRLTDYESRVLSAEKTGDVAALGTPREREIWAQIEQMEPALAGDGEALEASRDKLRLIKGVLYWQMHDAFKARAWGARKNMREVAQALRQTESRWSLVQEAKRSVPDRNGDFEARIGALRPRLQTAHTRLTALEKAQSDYLADVAVRELESQKERLSSYMLQARYSLATIYDRAGAASEAKPAEKPRSSSPATVDEPK